MSASIDFVGLYRNTMEQMQPVEAPRQPS